MEESILFDNYKLKLKILFETGVLRIKQVSMLTDVLVTLPEEDFVLGLENELNYNQLIVDYKKTIGVLNTGGTINDSDYKEIVDLLDRGELEKAQALVMSLTKHLR